VYKASGEVTHLLMELEQHEQGAAPKLFELLHVELRRLAQHLPLIGELAGRAPAP
jgi:hypothetical protein